MIEVKVLSDFYNYIKANACFCPICGKQIVFVRSGTFDMNINGRFDAKCSVTDCDFNKMNFAVESIGRG
jgi:hypothetical protein